MSWNTKTVYYTLRYNDVSTDPSIMGERTFGSVKDAIRFLCTQPNTAKFVSMSRTETITNDVTELFNISLSFEEQQDGETYEGVGFII